VPPAESTPHEVPAPETPADAPSEASGKKGLLGWISGAVSQLEAKAEGAVAKPEPPKPGSGPLPPRPASGPLGGQVRAASLKLPGSGPLRAGTTGELPPQRGPLPVTTPSGPLPLGTPLPTPTPVTTPSGPLPLATPLPGRAPDAPAEPEPATPAPKVPEDPASASRRRMAFIVAYMKDPTSDPEFADKPLVYRVFAEERDYQQQLVNTLKPQLERLPADDAEKRAELEQRLKTAQTRQSQLFLQLKKLTGVKGKTGGTGFLTASDVLPEPKGLGK
jgi:hypothetical protein